ncbi:PAS domain-containing protein [bacterium]|nr:PAS domain-containing protein [bacterium]
MKKFTLFMILCCLAFLFPGKNIAQQQFLPSLDPDKKIHHYVHDIWTMEDGLPSNSIWGITQTTDGYIWLGTYHGLVRFDGVNFTTFDRANTPQFKNNKILTISADPTGGLWIITSDNLLVKYSEGVFTKYSITDTLACGTLQCMYINESGTLWIGSSNGLVQYSGRSFSMVHPAGLKHGVSSICRDASGTIWFASTGSGLFSFQSGIYRQLTERDGLPFNNFIQICPEKSGGLWLFTTERHLYRYCNNVSTEIIKLYDRTYIFSDRAGVLWFGDKGLKRLGTNGIEEFSTTDGLSDNRVRTIFEDKDGSLWAGSYAGGLECFKNGNIKVLSVKEGLRDKEVWSVYEDLQGVLWAGTNNGYIYRIVDGEVSERIKLPAEASKRIAGNYIYAIIKDRGGHLWIGAHLGIYTLYDGHVKYHQHLSGIPVLAIHEQLTKPGTLIIATAEKGVYIYKDGVFRKKYTSVFKEEWGVTFISEDPYNPGIIWYGTNYGLVREDSLEITIYDQSDGLAFNEVTNLAYGTGGAIWISTAGGGLNLFKDGVFTAYTTDDGIYDDIIWSVIEDDHGRLWMSSDRGLFYVKKQDLLDYTTGKLEKIESMILGVSDGLKSVEFVGGDCSVVRRKNGELIYPTLHGVAFVNPVKEDVGMVPPPVYIEHITVNGDEITKVPGVIFKAECNNIEFSYTALSFLNPDKLRFKYKLEGYDKDWIGADIRRTAYYSNLSPGKYRFRVIASNNSGVWNDTGAEFVFSQSPYFYETWWFRILALILLILLIYAIINRRLIAERARNKALQKEIDERKRAWALLAESERRLQAIFDNTTSVMYMKDLEGRYIMVNRPFEDVNNITREEIVNKTPYDIFPHDTAVGFADSDREVLKKNRPIEFEDQVMHADGLHTYISVRFPLCDKDNNPYAVCGISTEITQRKQVEEEMRHLRNLLSNIINSMPSALVGVDMDSRVTQWNNGAEKVTGVTAEQAKGQYIHKVFPQCQLEMDRIKRAIKNRRIEQALKVKQPLAGEMYYCDITIFPLVANGVEGAVIRVDDVTERVRLEEMMIQSEKMMSVGGLAAGMAHEINNPLAGIIQTMQVIQNRVSADLPKNLKVAEACGVSFEKLVEYNEERGLIEMMKTVMESARRAATIVDNMLSFSRKSESKCVPVNIKDLMDKTIELCSSDYDMKKNYDFRDLEIIKEYASDLPLVPCEASKIQQVILNLLKNGAQAMQMENEKLKIENGEIKKSCFILRLAEDEQKNIMRIEIEDNGPGMDKAIRHRIFEPFFTTKAAGSGTGLGLSVSYFIITENHGGEMWVESVPGKGTVFIIRLPVIQVN